MKKLGFLPLEVWWNRVKKGPYSKIMGEKKHCVLKNLYLHKFQATLQVLIDRNSFLKGLQVII